MIENFQEEVFSQLGTPKKWFVIFATFPPPAKLKTPQWNLLGDTAQGIEIVEDFTRAHGKVSQIEFKRARLSAIAKD